jgi:hypothetical protein
VTTDRRQHEAFRGFVAVRLTQERRRPAMTIAFRSANQPLGRSDGWIPSKLTTHGPSLLKYALVSLTSPNRKPPLDPRPSKPPDPIVTTYLRVLAPTVTAFSAAAGE